MCTYEFESIPTQSFWNLIELISKYWVNKAWNGDCIKSVKRVRDLDAIDGQQGDTVETGQQRDVIGFYQIILAI